MKKLSLVAALLALAGVACGGDDDKKSDDKGGDGGGGGNGDNGLSIPDAGGGEEVPFPKCEREEVPSYPDYEGEPVWTSAEQMACGTACGMVPEAESEACITANCPGYEMFNDCVNGVLLSCLTADSKDGACRNDWETYICCADENCAEASEAEQEACLDKSCKAYIDDVGECIDENGDPNSQIPKPCIVQVVNRCIKQPTMGDAGMATMSGNLSFDRFFLRSLKTQMTQLRSAKSAR